MRKKNLVLTFQMAVGMVFIGLSFQGNAQIKLKDAEGKVQIMVNLEGEVFIENMEKAAARMEEYGENGEDGQNVKFYGKEGQVVADFIAQKNALVDTDQKNLALLTDQGLKDQASGKTLSFSPEGELLVDGEKKALFLDPNLDLVKDRILMVLYLALMAVQVDSD